MKSSTAYELIAQCVHILMRFIIMNMNKYFLDAVTILSKNLLYT